MTTVRPKDETRVTSPTAGDALLLDGATVRSIAVEDFYKAAIASDPEVAAFASVTSAADNLFYFTGSGTGALSSFTAFGRSLLALTASIPNSVLASAGATTLKGNPTNAAGAPSDFTIQGLTTLAPDPALDYFLVYDHTAGTLKKTTANAVLATNAQVNALAGVTSAANQLFYFTGAGTGTLTSITSFGRSVLAASSITNSLLASAGAATLKGNPTNAATTPTDFTIQGLVNLGSPDPTQDLLVIYDHVSGTLKNVTATALAGVISSGVASYNARTGTVVSRADDYANLDGLGLKNISFAVSASAGALTITMNDASGSALSASSPAVIAFRSLTSGLQVSRVITSSPSITIPSTSSCGVGNTVGCRLWIVGWDDTGPTFRLGVFNARDTTHIYPLDETQPGSSLQTVAGGNAAGQHYTAGAAVSGKSFRILGYVDWNASGMTGGTWTTTNLNNIQVMGIGVRKPGEPIGNRAWLSGGGGSSTTSTSMTNVTGASLSITPRSAANALRWSASHLGTVAAAGAGQNSVYTSQFLRGATTLATGQIGVVSGSGANQQSQGTIAYSGIDVGFNVQGAAITFQLQHATSNAAGQSTTANVNADVEEIMG